MVIPSGMRAAVNPRKRGMLEQEQNGVTAPNPLAMAYPRPRRFPERKSRIRSLSTPALRTPMTKIKTVTRTRIFETSSTKKCIASAQRPRGAKPATSYVSQSASNVKTFSIANRHHFDI
jgi:hypothetical protein